MLLADLSLSTAYSAEKLRSTNDTNLHGTQPKTQNKVVKEPAARLELDSEKVSMKKQIEGYAEQAEERYNQIAAHQQNTHTFAELASKLGEWEEKIDGKGK